MSNEELAMKTFLTPMVLAMSLWGQDTVPKMIGTYCAGCHNGQMRSPSGKLLDRFDPSEISQHPDVWTRVYRQLQAGAMPPMGAPRPDRATYAAAIASIDKSLTGSPVSDSPVSSQEVAARLAKLLWNSVPDAALAKDAEQGRLTNPTVVGGQVRRMLADERASAFVQSFFFPWLQLSELAKAEPDAEYFPDFDPSLKDAFAEETERFLLSQIRSDADPVELWSANYTFLNEQLAKYYGVAEVTGDQFRRVALKDPQRFGLLGQGSVLMATSPLNHGYGGYTSPATRSKWVRFHFFGIAPPNPFPGAQPVKPGLPVTPQTRTLPNNPCVSCHQNFFPLGYAFEHFDPVGRWRESDQIGPADASGKFVDGTPFNGVADLRGILLKYPDAFRTTITEKLLAYLESGSTNPTKWSPDNLIRARRILDSVPEPRWSTIIEAVVQASVQ
jgi:hypothetical protein